MGDVPNGTLKLFQDVLLMFSLVVGMQIGCKLLLLLPISDRPLDHGSV